MDDTYIWQCLLLFSIKGLPRKFCKDSLPDCELRMILEDENGKEHDVLYLGRKNGLSGGWRGFAIDHNLEDGDALIFELSAPARFKVLLIFACCFGCNVKLTVIIRSNQFGFCPLIS